MIRDEWNSTLRSGFSDGLCYCYSKTFLFARYTETLIIHLQCGATVLKFDYDTFD